MKFELADLADLEKKIKELNNKVIEGNIPSAESLGEIFWRDFKAAYSSVTLMDKFLEDSNTKKR